MEGSKNIEKWTTAPVEQRPPRSYKMMINNIEENDGALWISLKDLMYLSQRKLIVSTDKELFFFKDEILCLTSDLIDYCKELFQGSMTLENHHLFPLSVRLESVVIMIFDHRLNSKSRLS
jgi:hypothetical protein